MYCSKNTLLQYESKDPHAIYCGGPSGDGVESRCKRSCACYCEHKDDLEAAIGRIVLSRMDVLSWSEK